MKTNNLTRTSITVTIVSLAGSLALGDPPKQSTKAPAAVKSIKSTVNAGTTAPKAIDTKERNRLMLRMLELQESAKASDKAEKERIKQTLQAYFAERTRARNLAASGKGAAKPSIIGHIATRNVRVTIRNGSKGPVYELRSKDGRTILANELTPDQLHAYDPKLHAIVDRAMAAGKSSDGSYIDARAIPSRDFESPALISVKPQPTRSR